MANEILVIGGGISGLACAWRLRRGGHNVLLLEEKPEAGGNIRTEQHNGFRIECGPHTFMGSADDIFTLAEEVGLSDQIVPTRPSAKKRFIVRRGRIHEVPLGPWSFLTSGLLSPLGKFQLMMEPFRTQRGKSTDTARQFFDRRFGPEASRIMAGAFISGVYAGNPEELSAPAAFPLFWRFEQESGGMIRGAFRYRRERKAKRIAAGIDPASRRGLFTFAGGLGRISDGVARALGDRLIVDAAALSIRHDKDGFHVDSQKGTFRGSKLILAVPPQQASRLLAPVDPELGTLLGRIPLAPVAVVHLGFSSGAPRIPDGFGFLSPRKEGVRCLGVLFPSRLFADRTPPGGDLLAAFFGGVTDPEALNLDDTGLLQHSLQDLQQVTGERQKPDWVTVKRYTHAIPQFILGHQDRMKAIHGRLRQIPGLFLTGNYLLGVGMKDAVTQGFLTAATVETSLDSGSRQP